MSTTTVFMFVFFAILAIASIGILIWNINRLKSQVYELKNERDQIRINFDQIRKEKIDLDDKIAQHQAQERTYKVAYEDWKSKYELLEQKFLSYRKESEIKPLLENKPNASIPKTLESQHSETVDEKSLAKELKSVLDQHLEILKNLIQDEVQGPLKQKNIPSDPLHWIMGIDDDTSSVLKNMGIRTFEQLSELPRKEVKKMMVQFEDIEDKVIESWPLQAKAIINSRIEHQSEQ